MARRPDGCARTPLSRHFGSVCIFAVALLLRGLHIWQIRSSPFFASKLGDAETYHAWAQQIAAGDWFGHGVFYQAPLYPYFLGTIYTLLGDDWLVVRACQALVGALSCVLLAHAGWRLFSKPVGIAAGFLLALYPTAIFFDGLMQKSVLDGFFVCLLLWLASGIVREPRRRGSWYWLGLALGALVLTRENAVVFAVAILVWLFLQHRALGRQRLVLASLLLCGLVTVLSPVAVRNRIVGGELHLTTSQFGPNFYIGNNEAADGMYEPLRPGRGHARYEREDATELAERAMGRKLMPSEVSSYHTRRALHFIGTQPGAWSRLMARKFALAFNAVEISDTEDQYTYAEWSFPLRLTGHAVHVGVLAPLALLGIWITWRERHRLWLLHLMLAAYTASLVMFYVSARYRLPIVPFLMLFAAAGLVRLGGFLRANPPRRTIACATAVTAMAVFSNWGLLDRGAMQAGTYFNLGQSSELRGDSDQAIQWYREAVRRSPEFIEAHHKLSILYANRSQFDAAADHLEHALRIDRGRTDLHQNLGVVLLQTGNLIEAASQFEEALRIDPDLPNAHYQLGSVFARLGYLAAEHLERAVYLDPDLADAHVALGVCYEKEGRLAEAAAQYELALRTQPNHTRARERLNQVRVMIARNH